MDRTAPTRLRASALPAALALAIALPMLAALPCAIAGAATRLPPTVRHRAVWARADSLSLHSRAAFPAYVDSLLAAARAAHDDDLELMASLLHASFVTYARNDLAGGLAEAEAGVPKARAARDTLLWCLALRT